MRTTAVLLWSCLLGALLTWLVAYAIPEINAIGVFIVWFVCTALIHAELLKLTAVQQTTDIKNILKDVKRERDSTVQTVTGNPYQELERLHTLKEKGALSEEEFQEHKTKILSEKKAEATETPTPAATLQPEEIKPSEKPSWGATLIGWLFGGFSLMGAIAYWGTDGYQSYGFIFLFFAIIFFVSIRASGAKKSVRRIMTATAIIAFLFTIIKVPTLPDSENADVSSVTTAAQTQTAGTDPIPHDLHAPLPLQHEQVVKYLEAQQPPPSISFAVIRAAVQNESITDAQFKAFAKQQEGKLITERGYVVDVREKMFGGYTVWIDMDAPDVSMSVQDISFDVDEATAMNLRKDQAITFTGTIKSLMRIMGAASISLMDVQINS